MKLPMLLQENVWLWAGFKEARGLCSCWLGYSKATQPDEGQLRSRINELPSLYSEGSSRTGVKEWMAFSLSTDLFFSLLCRTSMVCTPGHFPEGGNQRNPGLEERSQTFQEDMVLGFIFYSLSSRPWHNGQGGLAYCDSWGRKESDTTERLNWTELNWTLFTPSSITFPHI